jgi:uncharacterized Tic20 family protein
MNISDEIERLRQLRDQGALNDEEFARAKQRVLGDALPPEAAAAGAGSDSLEQQARDWALFLHLSQLLGFMVPLGGLIAPLLIWQVKKDELPALDAHGKLVMNWVLSALIYTIVAGLLSLIVIGIPLLIIVLVLGVVFPIVGGIKASNGELWPYPLSIPFLK